MTRRVLSWAMALSLLSGQATWATGAAENPGAAKAFDKGVPLRMAVSLKGSTSLQVKNNIEAFKAEGFQVEALVIPADGTDYDKKLAISLMGGEPIDLINCNNATIAKYIGSGTIAPLDEYAKRLSYDVDKTFGANVHRVDGKLWGIAASRDQWLTYYNKKIFDDAKVPYPAPLGWTWEKYIETARKLNDPSRGIYGSFMVQNWGQHAYLLAKQKKAREYKADGSSNFDDPLWAQAMKWFFDLGNTLQIQQDLLTFKSKKTNFDAFFATGKYGMCVIGAWSYTMMKDFKLYPREWKVGILPFPYPAGYPKTDLALLALRCVPSTSKHKPEAFAATAFLCENFYKINTGILPSKVTLTEKEMNDLVERDLVKDYEFDGITAADVRAVFFDPATELVAEKMTGLGGPVIDQAFSTEGELYGLSQKGLEEAMKEIKVKADKAIVEEKASQ